MAQTKLGSIKRTDTVIVGPVNLAADVGSSVLPVANGGTGSGSFTNGQLLIGNTTGNTLAKATLTATANQTTVTNGSGSITIGTVQDIGTSSTPVFAGVDTPLITHSGGALELRPGSGYDLDITLGTGTARAHITSSTGTAALTPTLLVLTKTYTGGGPDTGGGQDIQWEATSSTTNNVTQAVRKTSWVDVTHATRKSRVTESVYDTAARQCLVMEATGSAPAIGFLGASASARLASPDIGTALTTFGLTSGTPTFATANLTGLGTGVGTALAINVGTSGCFVVNGGALGTPSSGTVTNLTGTASININGTVGATTPSTGVFTDLTVNGNTIIGDASTDTVNVKAAAWTFPATGGVTVTKPAESSTAELIQTWKVSDSGSDLTISNQTANVSEFSPLIGATIEAGLNSTALTFSGTKGANNDTNPAILYLTKYNSGSGNTDLANTTCMVEFRNRATTILRVFPVSLTCKDAFDIVVGTSTGTKIGTSTSQKLSLWNKTPIVQPTTGITGATFVANSGTAVNDASTFGGYTLKQLAAAMVNFGLVA